VSLESEQTKGQLKSSVSLRRFRGLPFVEGAAVALVCLFAILAFSSSLSKSLTWDEPSFISGGYTYLTKGDFRFNPSHPPLLQELMALPLVFQDLQGPPGDFAHWESRSNPVVAYGKRFLFQSGNNPQSMAFWARLPILLLGILLVCIVFLWGRRLYGPRPALMGTALVALSPNLLAHARLATEDLGCTILMFASVWAFWFAIQRSSNQRWILCGGVTGLALLAKYTSLLLAPIFLVLLGALWMRRHPTARSPRTVIVALCILGGTAIFVVGAGYNFSFDWTIYLTGLRRIYTDLVEGYQWYFMGSFYDHALWYYALGAFILKTPVSTLLLLALALFFAFRDRDHSEAALFLLVPPLFVFGASFFDTGNFGFRRILPAIPFLFLFASHTLTSRRHRSIQIGVLILVAWSAVQTFRIHPHYLSYFNTAVGGPKAGPQFLDDSNIDWGQDLPALADWQADHPEATPLRLMYFGVANPAAYGVNAVPMTDEEIAQPRPGYYAVSAHLLARFKSLGDPNLDWLNKYSPIGRAGWSIWLYRFP
jgi:4-amino-4-deoxy-L-arabinose transferase-like glycosyltransferase